jgi:hypothetical protein
LDPESKEIKSQCFDVFYEKQLPKLVEVLKTPLHALQHAVPAETSEQSEASEQLRPVVPLEMGLTGRESHLRSVQLGLELVGFCVRTHGVRMRNYVVHSSLLEALAPLYQHPAKAVRLDMLRLFRTLIGTKDDVLLRHIVKHDAFQPVFVLLRVCTRDNILSAALLELFDYIKKESLRHVIAYLLSSYHDDIFLGPYARTHPFQALRAKTPATDDPIPISYLFSLMSR